MLARCLEALLAQDFAPEDYEVIIVDDATCEQTRFQVEQYAQKSQMDGHNLRYIPATGTRGPAAARNIGWRAAHAEIIAFTDDDCVPSPGWLRAGMNALGEDVVALAGRIIMPLPNAPTDYEYNAFHLTQSEFVTANCFFRRDALNKKHPVLYRQKVQASPPWHYYCIVCALLVLLISVFSEARLLT